MVDKFGFEKVYKQGLNIKTPLNFSADEIRDTTENVLKSGRENFVHFYIISMADQKRLEDEKDNIMEKDDHPWFLGVQFHPELKSTPFKPHPIFNSYIEALIKNKS